jgi:hypothetical protein
MSLQRAENYSIVPICYAEIGFHAGKGNLFGIDDLPIALSVIDDGRIELINLIREPIRGIRATIPIRIEMIATKSNISGISTTIEACRCWVLGGMARRAGGGSEG